MPVLAPKTLLTAAALFLVVGVPHAQTPRATDTDPFPRPIELQPIQRTPLAPMSASESQLLRQALAAARRKDVAGARSLIGAMSDPVGKKLATWALVDVAGDSIGFFEADQARRDLAGWPRGAARQTNAERLLATSGMSAQQTIAWFGGEAPASARGALALASALNAAGQQAEATALIRRVWRDQVFEADVQASMLAQFGGYLRPEDHVRRADRLLYGQQGPAAQAMLGLLPPDERAIAETRIALRSGSPAAEGMLARLTPSQASHPGIAFERAAYHRARGQESRAYDLLAPLPEDQAGESAAAGRVWRERYPMTLAAIRAGDYRNAYRASANTGLKVGASAAEAEFYAGWIALRRLNNPQLADRHFAAIAEIGSAPITLGRAYYWRGRAHEAMGDAAAAQSFYRAASEHNTTFYGQLAGEKVGDGTMTLPPEPEITEFDRARFEGRDVVRAARRLNEIGESALFRTFALHLKDTVPNAAEQALIVDMARGYGDQTGSMLVVRGAATLGHVLPLRGYPHRTPPQVPNAPELALTLSITRQESGFDPVIRSPAGARGMMQVMPATAQIVARQMGLSYSADMLDEPDYNMRLGQTYISQMLNQFSGSYPLAIAAYNAGPGRPNQWVGFCGDPRGAGTDPIDFIECIPFSETRNYVMRVMEGTQVYRARLNNGTARITVSQDLARGGYAYARPTGAGAP
ncbi:lytic transglycosylase domain-containing protein [Phenylobacterium sp.]|uniref:lytic transglycosylase domain-containing protein n=1 Tax=Phenylobacterium sp. TaxID=1871053 RepID=UPI0027303636|nr:lytic transglycosylase domain-containing protein [Phenylobacterium sp.]MDP2213580.1 lytic transglycosylase domain-containing protein [Phenylobacterium sp.]